jgi:hypothetical protein
VSLEPIRNPPPGGPVDPMTITGVTGVIRIIHSLGITNYAISY